MFGVVLLTGAGCEETLVAKGPLSFIANNSSYGKIVSTYFPPFTAGHDELSWSRVMMGLCSTYKPFPYLEHTEFACLKYFVIRLEFRTKLTAMRLFM